MDQMLGILMLDTHFLRIKGDVGNPASFSYPVRKLTVRGASPDRVVREADPSLLEPFLQAAEQLERGGCAAITTSCGFLAIAVLLFLISNINNCRSQKSYIW